MIVWIVTLAAVVVSITAATGGKEAQPIRGERLFKYVINGAGVLAFLWGITGLIALLAVQLLGLRGPGATDADARTAASHLLAALVVGLLLLGASVLLCRDEPASRPSRERGWWHAVLLAAIGLGVIVSAHDLLASFATALSGGAGSAGRDAVSAAVQLVLWGVTWAWLARSPRASSQDHEDRAWESAVFLLSSWALAYLAIGLVTALRELIVTAGSLGSPTILGGSQGPWAGLVGSAAWILPGALAWTAATVYDLRRNEGRGIRVVYLYLGVVAGAAMAIGGVAALLDELLLRAFGDHVAATFSGPLADSLPLALTGALLWGACWSLMKVRSESHGAAGSIPWPRLPAFVGFSLAGVLITVPGLVALLWLVLDAVTHAPQSLTGSGWWHHQAAAPLAALVVGVPMWALAWRRLERSVAADARADRAGEIVTRLAGVVVLGAALAGIGFLIATLWLLFQQLLGAGTDATRPSWMLKDLASVLVLAGVGMYHARAYGRLRGATPEREPSLRVSALVEPGLGQALASLEKAAGAKIEVTGYLSGATVPGGSTVDALAAQIEALRRQEISGAVLVLTASGGVLFPYHSEAAQSAAVDVGAVATSNMAP